MSAVGSVKRERIAQDRGLAMNESMKGDEYGNAEWRMRRRGKRRRGEEKERKRLAKGGRYQIAGNYCTNGRNGGEDDVGMKK